MLNIGNAKRSAEIISALYNYDPRYNTSYAEEFVEAIIDSERIVAQEQQLREQALIDQGMNEFLPTSYQVGPDSDVGGGILVDETKDIIKKLKPFLHLEGPDLITGLDTYFNAMISSDQDFTVVIPSNMKVFPRFESDLQPLVAQLVTLAQNSTAVKTLRVKHLQNGVISWVTFEHNGITEETFTAFGSSLAESLQALVWVIKN
jgi:hypothetical protein